MTKLMLALAIFLQDTAVAVQDTAAAGDGLNPLDPTSPEGIMAIIGSLAAIFFGVKKWRSSKKAAKP